MLLAGTIGIVYSFSHAPWENAREIDRAGQDRCREDQLQHHDRFEHCDCRGLPRGRRAAREPEVPPDGASLMAIPDSDPRARELDAAFEAAANGPARPRAEAKTPAEIDHDAPFGRDDDGTAKAPYGLTKDGIPKRSAGGRPPKDSPDRPRTGTVTDIRPGAATD